MLPDIHIGRDAPIAAALTLQHLAKFQGTLSELKATLPQWEIVKLKAPLAGLDPNYAIAKIKVVCVMGLIVHVLLCRSSG